MSTLVIDHLISLYDRDLNRLKDEVLLYKDEQNLWIIDKNINNSAGNLCLHLIGNLKTYIGNGLSRTDYIRDRAFEFKSKDVERTTLITEIEETLIIVRRGLMSLDQKQLSDDFPIIIWGEASEMLYTLLHLHSHINYHLGQINYHRRMLDS